MKKLGFWLTTALISASAVGLGGANRAEARTLVGCGPNAAAYIVEKVPTGCYVLQTSYREPAVEDTDFQQTPTPEDPETDMMDGTTDTDTIDTPAPGMDTQGPNTAPDTSPATPGTAIPGESPNTDTAPGTTDGFTQPGADTQGPNAAPDTSPATPGTAIPGESPQ
jgi:hypothetical protein